MAYFLCAIISLTPLPSIVSLPSLFFLPALSAHFVQPKQHVTFNLSRFRWTRQTALWGFLTLLWIRHWYIQLTCWKTPAVVQYHSVINGVIILEDGALSCRFVACNHFQSPWWSTSKEHDGLSLYMMAVLINEPVQIMPTCVVVVSNSLFCIKYV